MPSRGPIRLALGLGDQELEQRLRPALDADLDLAIAVHCLAADQVLQAVEARRVDAVVLAAGLHRLNEPLLRDLERTRTPVVLLAADDDPLALSTGPRAVPAARCRSEHAAPGHRRGCGRRTLDGSAAPGPRRATARKPAADATSSGATESDLA